MSFFIFLTTYDVTRKPLMVGKLLVQAQCCTVPRAHSVCWLCGVGKRFPESQDKASETVGTGSAWLSGVHLAIGRAGE